MMLVTARYAAFSADVACPLILEAEWRPSGDINENVAAKQTLLVRKVILGDAFLQVDSYQPCRRLDILKAFHSPCVSGCFVDLSVGLQGPLHCVVAYVNRYPVEPYSYLGLIEIDQ